MAQDRVVVFLTCITGLGQIAAEGHRKEQAGAVKRRVCTFTSHCQIGFIHVEQTLLGPTVLEIAADLDRKLSQSPSL